MLLSCFMEPELKKLKTGNFCNLHFLSDFDWESNKAFSALEEATKID